MNAYYNEHDLKSAAWLRELIRGGHIAPGDVDERSIADVQPGDLDGYAQCHFFAGIGGWSLALRLAGVADERAVWTGSCPCQPFSCAGLQLGTDDERHLWPHFLRLIAQRKPSVVLGEQVASPAALLWLDGVFTDLEGAGYACGAADLCAAGAGEDAEGRIVRGGEAAWERIVVGAPHIRQRIYWVANADSRESRRLANGKGCERHGSQTGRKQGDSESECGCTARGLGDADGSGSQPGQLASTPHGHGSPALANGSSSGLGDTVKQGLQEQRGIGTFSPVKGPTSERQAVERASAPINHWSNFDTIPCRDGKTRRIERGTFPLVARLPRGVVPSGDPSVAHAQATAEGRIVRLRGYGNAINPQVAAEFIKASFEAIA